MELVVFAHTALRSYFRFRLRNLDLNLAIVVLALPAGATPILSTVVYYS
jgi:hypothetical protein